MPKHKPDIRFDIHTESDTWSGSLSYSLKLEAQVITPDGVKTPGHFWRDEPDYATNPLENFCITALYDRVDGKWFGWSCEFRQPHAVDEERAAAMLKLLRRVRVALDKRERELGPPENFEAYAMRVARAVGCHSYEPFIMYHRGETQTNGTDWSHHGPTGLRWKLDQITSGKIPPTHRR